MPTGYYIQAFIKSEVTRRMFTILDREYEHFCPQLAKYFEWPLKVKKCLYETDFSGKSWYETLDSFIVKNLKRDQSRVEGCIYILRIENDWIKLINYVDNVLNSSNNDKFWEILNQLWWNDSICH